MTKPRRASTEDAKSREAEILATATRLFQRDGFEGTPVTRIAAEAGMTAANLYWYFPSKHHLLNSVLMEQYRSSYEVLLAADDPDADAPARLNTYVHTFVELQLDGDEDDANFAYLSLQNSLGAEAKAGLRVWQLRHRQLLKDILLAGARSGEFDFADLTVATSMLATSVEYVFLWFNQEGRLTPREVADEYARLALLMVGAGSPNM